MSKQKQTSLMKRLFASPQYASAVNSIRFRRSALPEEDLIAEFHRGIAQGLLVVKPDVGDPMEYLLDRGRWRVREVVRKTLRETTQQRCTDCNNFRSFDYDKKCKKCGSIGNQETDLRFSEISDNVAAVVKDNYEGIIVKLLLEKRFLQGSMKRKVIDLILAGHDKSDIPDILHVSRQRISVLIRRIREDLNDAKR